MALTQPFINNIPSFDARVGTAISLNVLGGDAITSFTYFIYDNETNEPIILDELNGNTFITEIVANDSVSESIRSFSFEIPAGILRNATTYRITAYTRNDEEQSINSSYQLFTCYRARTISISYEKPNPSGAGYIYETLRSGVTITAPQIYIRYAISNYPSPISWGVARLYGVKNDGSKELVYETEKLHQPQQTLMMTSYIKNFYPTNQGLYDSYTVVAYAVTVDNTEVETEIDGILCDYNIVSGESDLLKVENMCNLGIVNICVDLTTFADAYNKFTISYKERNSTEWILLQTINETDMDPYSLNYIKAIFDFPYCGNNRVYDFKLDIYADNGSVLTEATASVLSKFNKNYICDKDINYDTTVEYQLGSVQLTTKVSSYEPYGSQFPIVSKNTVTKYREGQSTALLLAPTSLSKTNANIDRFGQVKLVDEFNNWLSNGKAKILKDFNGNLRIIAITTAISNSYYKELGNGIASTSFSWKEIGTFNDTDLKKLGMINNFNIIYKNY